LSVLQTKKLFAHTNRKPEEANKKRPTSEKQKRTMHNNNKLPPNIIIITMKFDQNTSESLFSSTGDDKEYMVSMSAYSLLTFSRKTMGW